MKRMSLFWGALLIAVLACGGSVKTKTADVTAFVDESGKGTWRESYPPLPNTFVVAEWNVYGGIYREVKLTDQNGHANFSHEYTEFFDIRVFPPCGYYSTTPLNRDMSSTDKAEFGFWPASNPDGALSNVKMMVWKDANSNGKRDPQEEITDEKATIMFKLPRDATAGVYNQDNFLQEPHNGWFDIKMGNSCGTIYVLLLNSNQTSASVSEPGKVSDAGAHGNTYYPSIEIPYGPGETSVYWEIK
jgi:hypothetical protein